MLDGKVLLAQVGEGAPQQRASNGYTSRADLMQMLLLSLQLGCTFLFLFLFLFEFILSVCVNGKNFDELRVNDD